eukprot:gene33920-43827_t
MEEMGYGGGAGVQSADTAALQAEAAELRASNEQLKTDMENIKKRFMAAAKKKQQEYMDKVK